MKELKHFLTISFLSLFLCSTIFAQEIPEINVSHGGTIQFWSSFGEINGADTNSMGFGLRRVRYRTYVNIGDNLKAYIQTELTSFALVDARIDYLFSKNFSVRVGRFKGAGVRGAGLTSHIAIDITERPLTAQRWGSSTIGSDTRDYGIDFVGKLGDFKVNATIHNGDGSLNIRNRMSGPGPQSGGFALSGMVAYKPASVKGLEAGAYYGMGNKEINEYTAFNGYVYWEPNPIRVKAELIGWTNTVGGTDISQLGFYVFGAYRFAEKFEILARYENYDTNTDIDNNEIDLFTFGASYSMIPTKWLTSKITAAYVVQSEDPTADNNTFQLIWQLVF